MSTTFDPLLPRRLECNCLIAIGIAERRALRYAKMLPSCKVVVRAKQLSGVQTW